jgi:hypothetical protein
MILKESTKRRAFGGTLSLAQKSRIRLFAICAFVLGFSMRAPAQNVQPQTPQLGRVLGTVTDLNGNAVESATVVLAGPDSADRRTVTTPDSGSFEFDDVRPSVPYHIIVAATDFVEWTSPAIVLEPGQVDLLGGVALRLVTQNTTVHVTYNPAEIAIQQLKVEETQRVLGVIPNFYIAYSSDAAALTTKLKFQLALKVSTDVVTIAGVGLVSGIKQATNTPNYGQGAQGFAKRFGATAADGVTDIMIGGAILPSLLHQDPRYFYQGTGTNRSRIRHAILSPFMCKGDNGRWQPNYSSLGGDLASSAIANTYYPNSNRGASLVFSNFAIGTGERIGASLAQEFVLGRLTHRSGHIK